MMREWFSIIRRRADWASWVMLSASSRMMILNGGAGYELSEAGELAGLAPRREGSSSRIVVLCDCRLRKVLDLLAHDLDSTLIGGVELEYTRPVELWAVELLAKGEDRRGLSGARGSVEEHVRKLRKRWSGHASRS